MNTQSFDEVTVIGAGVVGLSCAVCLQEKGFHVTLIDRQAPGRGASYGNAGSISVGSVVPVALPGMLSQVPSWLFDPQGPLAIKWPYLPRALPWLLRWIMAANGARATRYAAALSTLTLSAVDEWSRILEPEDREEFIRRNGQLLVSRNADPGPGDRLAMHLREVNGVRVDRLSRDEIRQLDPGLSTDFASGYFIPDSGHTTSPYGMSLRLFDYFEKRGGRFVSADIETLECGADGTITGLITPGGRMAVDRVVIALGAYSASLARMAGDRIPLDTERGYHCQLMTPDLTLPRPTSDMDRKFFATGIDGGVRVAGTVEIAGTKAPPDYRRARLLLRQGRDMYPDLNISQHRFWMGRRPSIPDSMPVIGPASGAANAWYAFGHGHIGLTTAPITGRIIAALVAGDEPPIDAAPFSPARFKLR